MHNTEKLAGLLILMMLCVILERTDAVGAVKKKAGEWDRQLVYRRIISNCSDFHVSETAHSKVYYAEEDVEFVPLVQRTVDLYLPLLQKDYALQNTRAVVVLCPDERLFQRNVGKVDRLPMGAYYGGVLNIVSPRLWTGTEAEAVERFITGGPIVHELSHLLTDIKTGGQVETWLTEGTALYYEYKYTGYEWRPDLAGKCKEISVTELRRHFRKMEEGHAYRRAFDIVLGIAQRHGEGKLQAMFSYLSEGKKLALTP